MKSRRVHRENLSRAVDREWNHRHSGLDRDIRRAVLKRLQNSVVRPAALGKNQDGNIAGLDDTRSQRHGFYCGPRILAWHRNVAGLAEMRAEQRDLEQPVLSHESK